MWRRFLFKTTIQKENALMKKANNTIVAMMPVRNEAGRYLEKVLGHLSQWVDKIVILDDCSTDGTANLARKFEKAIVYEGGRPLFAEDESALRSKLWELAVKENPAWIAAVDADEIMEDRLLDEIDFLTDQDYFDAIYFRVFDFWGSESHYRKDGCWNPWNKFSPFIVRYKPHIDYIWPKREIHCPRFPSPCESFSPYYSDIRVKHYGWANENEHYKKYVFYKQKDLKLYNKVLPHTQSIIIKPGPQGLEEWKEAKRLYFLKENACCQ